MASVGVEAVGTEVYNNNNGLEGLSNTLAQAVV